jgi:hypothetical protein
MKPLIALAIAAALFSAPETGGVHLGVAHGTVGLCYVVA